MRGWPRPGILVRLVRPDSPEIRKLAGTREGGVAARKCASGADLLASCRRVRPLEIQPRRLLPLDRMEICPHHSDKKKCAANLRALQTRLDERANATEA